MRRRSGAAGALMLAALAAGCAGPPPRSVRTEMGQPVLVGAFTDLTRGCAGTAPRMTVARAPAHGQLRMEPGPMRQMVADPRFPGCAGRTVQGIQVWYDPAPGFTGHDQFVVGVRTGRLDYLTHPISVTVH
jgi:hypothetical protein